MSRQSYRTVLVVLLVLISAPYLLGFALAGEAWAFHGFLLNPIDGHSYLAKMHQGAAGAWRFQLPYTSEPGAGAYLFLNYLALGHLARLTGLPAVLIFHLARLAGAFVMATGLVRFYQQTLAPTVLPGAHSQAAGAQNSTVRKAVILGLFGSGMGWLLVFFGLLPSDLWVAEMYPFLSAYANPHFPLGLGLILWLLVLQLRVLERLSPVSPVGLLALAGLGLLLGVVQPFGVVVLALLLAGLLLWEWAAGKQFPLQAVLAGAASVVPGGLYLLYQYSAILSDPVLAGWNAQNVTASPPAWDFVVSLSPALLLACLAAWNMTRSGAVQRGTRLLLIWAAAGVVLAYVPFALQRRFLTGYFVPLAGLAAVGVVHLQSRWPQKRAAIWRTVLGLSVVSNLIVLVIGLFGILAHAPEFYISQDDAAALAWVRENTAPDAILLAGPEMGLVIPSQIGRRVIYGHPFETVDAEREEGAVLAAYNGEIDTQALAAFLKDRQIDYIYYGTREQALGGEPAFTNYPMVYQHGETRIFDVRAIE